MMQAELPAGRFVAGQDDADQDDADQGDAEQDSADQGDAGQDCFDQYCAGKVGTGKDACWPLYWRPKWSWPRFCSRMV